MLPDGRRALLQTQQELPQQVQQAHQQQQQAVRSKLSVELARKSDAAAASADGGADTDDTIEEEHTEQVSGSVYITLASVLDCVLQLILTVEQCCNTIAPTYYQSASQYTHFYILQRCVQ
jgi:uncharacterized membrane protein YheB (UPF0754 family)